MPCTAIYNNNQAGASLQFFMKNNVEVLIGGRVYTIVGAESEEYIKNVASYVEEKIKECEQIKSYRYQDATKKNVLVALNIADDYFKVKDKLQVLEEKEVDDENEISRIKQEIVHIQMKYEQAKKDLEDAKLKIAGFKEEKEN